MTSPSPIPALMIATVVGAPLEDASELHRLSNLLQQQFDAIAVMTRREELERAAEEFDAYVAKLVEDRRRSPGDDLVSELIAAEQEGDRLSDEECQALVRDVLNGGVDTTQSQLSHGVRMFADHPDQWEAAGPRPVARAAGRRGGAALRARRPVHRARDAGGRRVPRRHVPAGHRRDGVPVDREPRVRGRRGPDAVRHPRPSAARPSH